MQHLALSIELAQRGVRRCVSGTTPEVYMIDEISKLQKLTTLNKQTDTETTRQKTAYIFSENCH